MQARKIKHSRFNFGVKIAGVVAVAAVIAACGTASGSGDTTADSGAADSSAPAASSEGVGAASSDATKVSFFLSTSQADFPYTIAKAKGFFADEGIDATIHQFPSGADATSAFMSENGDFIQAGDLPSLLFAAKGDSTFVSSVVQIANGVLLITKKDVTSYDGLKGKKIGLAVTSSPGYWIDKILDERQLAGDLEVVNLSNPDQPSALISGSVDALITFPAAGQAILSKNPDYHVLDSFPTSNYLLVRSSLLQENPDAVTAVLKALERGGQFIGDHLDEAAEIEAKADGVTPEAVKSWNDPQWNATYQVQFNGNDYELLNGIAAWAKGQGNLSKDFNLCSVVDAKAAAAAASSESRVTECS